MFGRRDTEGDGTTLTFARTRGVIPTVTALDAVSVHTLPDR